MREAGFLGKTWALVRKDLRIEMRARETVPPMLAFAFTVTILLAFALPPVSTLRAPVDTPVGAARLADVLGGFLWVTILFSGLIGFARTFELERADGAIDSVLLAPLDRSGLFAAKAAINLLYLVAVEIFLVPAFGILFSANLGAGWFVLILVMALADIGFVTIGTLFSALAAHTRSRELMLPVLALPMLVPLFIAAVALTSDVLGGAGLEAVVARGWFGILVAFDVIFLVVGALTFEFAVDQR
jgi:heme exporter protein B